MNYETARTVWAERPVPLDVIDPLVIDRLEEAEAVILSHPPETLDDLHVILDVIVAQEGESRSDQRDAQAMGRMLSLVHAMASGGSGPGSGLQGRAA